jgi:hypothetical protein
MIISESENYINHSSIQGNWIIVSQPGGVLALFDNEASKLEPVKKFEFGHEISSLTLSDTQRVAYVSLWDAPFYSICVLDLDSMSILAKHATSSFVERYAYKGF